MNYILLIDTSVIQQTTVALIADDGNRYEQKVIHEGKKSQMVLQILEILMKEHNVAWDQVKEVKVTTGPGSFTGLRVGTSIAATISWICNVPLNDKPSSTIPTLKYGKDSWKT